jgi:hypothetical protein
MDSKDPGTLSEHRSSSNRSCALISASLREEVKQRLVFKSVNEEACQLDGILKKRRMPTETVDAYSLAWRKIHHLAFQCEVVAFFRAAHYPFAGGADDFYSEIVELEGGVCW